MEACCLSTGSGHDVIGVISVFALSLPSCLCPTSSGQAGNRSMAYRPSAPKWMQGAPIAKGTLRFCRVALACTVRSPMTPRPWRVISPEPLGPSRKENLGD
jgi:hypothetical protein